MNNRCPEGDKLFTIALISDTHVNESESNSASPYPANAEANPRMRFAIEMINQHHPVATIHLGDMINPVPELPSYPVAAKNFNAIAARLNSPLCLMPGNHDIGDKPVSWMPAGMVSERNIRLYEKHFGASFQAFVYQKVHFVMINASLINSGLEAEKKQKVWLEDHLAANRDERIFLFSHYPPFVSHPDEPGSYDNIDQPGRDWLLQLIHNYQPEALFAAHVHNFWYDVIGTAEYYILPSTCFVRHDYSEMYRIDGGDQKGRNDSAKLGYVTLDIHKTGHVARWHRTYGKKLAEDGVVQPLPAPKPHVKTCDVEGIYIDMRHAWCEEMVVAPSGAVDEFRRKKARNDYPLLALWEMGIRGLRIPMQDLMDDKTRQRMNIMRSIGHRFHVYCYGLPNEPERQLISEHRQLVERLELVLDFSSIEAQIEEFNVLNHECGIPLFLSRINRKDTAKHANGHYNHLISHGFSVDEVDELRQFILKFQTLIDGVMISLPRSLSPFDTLKPLCALTGLENLTTVMYIKSTNASPAEQFEDEHANALRFAEAALCSTHKNVEVILDTFDDIDRGYFTRTGLVDRRFNPRRSGQIMGELIHQLNQGQWRQSSKTTMIDQQGQTVDIIEQLNRYSNQELTAKSHDAVES